MRIVISLVAVTCLITACGSTGVVKLEENRYMVSVKSAKVGFVSAAEEEASAYRQANEFCSDLGKEVQETDLQTTRSGFARSASATLEFACINAGTVIDAGESTNSTQANDAVEANDRYADLERLKRLLDDGTLTQEEFDREKAKILHE